MKKIILMLSLALVYLVSANASPHTPGAKDSYPLAKEEKRLGLELTGRPATLHKVLIGFRSLPGTKEKALLRGAGGTVRHAYHLVPAIAATLPEDAIERLLSLPEVTRIEVDGVVQANDAELDNTWGVKHINAMIAHDAGNQGAGVRVAVIDTGIDYTHPDLDGNYFGGIDFVDEDNDPMDDNGHGTHVAGTIAAEDDGSGVVGVAPQAGLYALKVLNAGGSGYWSDIIAALQWSVDNGIEVTNNSYESVIYPGETVRNAFQNAESAGIVHVAAAGNSGNLSGTGDNVNYPALFESVIAVGATDSSDSRASFSSTGAAVELAAPGVAINSTLPGGGYGEKDGTSMASPHVAGTAALVIAAGISDANGDGFIADEVRLRLQGTADDLGESGRDPLYGFGLVDAGEAADIGMANQIPAVSITSPVDGSSYDSGATIPFAGTATDTEDGNLTGNLVWASSIDGQIGSGGDFPKILGDGNHTITASATDSGGKAGSASISVIVGGPVEPPTGSILIELLAYTSSGGKNKDKHLHLTIALVNDLGSPIGGASVSIELDNDSGGAWSYTGITDDNGEITFSLNNAPSGCYTTTVTDVSATGLIWDNVTPDDNQFCKQ